MVAAPADRNEKLPGTIFTARQVRLLKIAVVIMGIILIAGFSIVVGTIFYQASRLGKSELAPADWKASLTLKPGEAISHIALDGDRLAVHVSGQGVSEIRIVDLASGKVIARVAVTGE